MTGIEGAKRGRPALDADAIALLRASIIEAAATTFAERGATAATIDDVARTAGVSRATVYRHAGGRDDLILAVTLRRFGEWVDGVVGHAEQFESAGAIITEAIVWTVKTVHRDPSLESLFAGGTAVAASEVLTKRPALSATNPWHVRFGDLLRRHQPELRVGLDAGAVADHVLSVLLDELARHHRRDEVALRAWVSTWLLPAVLEHRPPLPDRAPAASAFARSDPSNRSTQTSVA